MQAYSSKLTVVSLRGKYSSLDEAEKRMSTSQPTQAAGSENSSSITAALQNMEIAEHVHPTVSSKLKYVGAMLQTVVILQDSGDSVLVDHDEAHGQDVSEIHQVSYSPKYVQVTDTFFHHLHI